MLNLEWVTKKLLPCVITRKNVQSSSSSTSKQQKGSAATAEDANNSCTATSSRAASPELQSVASTASLLSSSTAESSSQQLHNNHAATNDGTRSLAAAAASTGAAPVPYTGPFPASVVPPLMLMAIFDEALAALKKTSSNTAGQQPQSAVQEVVLDTTRANKTQLKSSSSTSSSSRKVIIVGPTRGHAVPLARFLLHHISTSLQEEPKLLPSFVFLGDYIDSGPCSLENLAIVLSLMVAYERERQNSVAEAATSAAAGGTTTTTPLLPADHSSLGPVAVLLRGRHEEVFPAPVKWTGSAATGYRRLDDELSSVFDSSYDNTPMSLIAAIGKLKQIFRWMPVAAVVRCYNRRSFADGDNDDEDDDHFYYDERHISASSFLCLPGGPSPALMRHTTFAEMKGVIEAAANRVLRNGNTNSNNAVENSPTTTTTTTTSPSSSSHADKQLIGDIATAEPYEDDEDRAATTAGILFSDNPDPSRDAGMCCFSTEAAATLLARSGCSCIFRGSCFSLVKISGSKGSNFHVPTHSHESGNASPPTTANNSPSNMYNVRPKASPYDPGYRMYRLPSHVKRAVQQGGMPSGSMIASPLTMSAASSANDLSALADACAAENSNMNTPRSVSGGGNSNDNNKNSNSPPIPDLPMQRGGGSMSTIMDAQQLSVTTQQNQQQQQQQQQFGSPRGGLAAGGGAADGTTQHAAHSLTMSLLNDASGMLPGGRSGSSRSKSLLGQQGGSGVSNPNSTQKPLPQMVSLFSAPHFGNNFKSRNLGCAAVIQCGIRRAQNSGDNNNKKSSDSCCDDGATPADDADDKYFDLDSPEKKPTVLVSLVQFDEVDPLLFAPVNMVPAMQEELYDQIVAKRHEQQRREAEVAAATTATETTTKTAAQEEVRVGKSSDPLTDAEQGFLRRVRRLGKALKSRNQLHLLRVAPPPPSSSSFRLRDRVSPGGLDASPSPQPASSRQQQQQQQDEQPVVSKRAQDQAEGSVPAAIVTGSPEAAAAVSPPEVSVPAMAAAEETNVVEEMNPAHYDDDRDDDVAAADAEIVLPNVATTAETAAAAPAIAADEVEDL